MNFIQTFILIISTSGYFISVLILMKRNKVRNQPLRTGVILWRIARIHRRIDLGKRWMTRRRIGAPSLKL